MDVFIVGCGYVGTEVAKRLQNAGYSLAASTRRSDSARQLTDQGINAFAYDWLQTDPFPVVGTIENLVVAVSHAPVDGIPPKETHVRGISQLLAQLKPLPKRIIYLSTTGVMDNSERATWVDETSPVLPQRPGSIAAWEAEKWLTQSQLSCEFTVMRLAGVYGPSRIPNLESIRDQKELRVDPDSYLNLIHVADIAGLVEQSCQQLPSHALYMVSDGHPVLRRNYYEWICQQADLPNPVFSEARSGEGRGAGNKRVSNRRLVEDFGYDFQYPSYREGLLPLLNSADR